MNSRYKVVGSVIGVLAAVVAATYAGPLAREAVTRVFGMYQTATSGTPRPRSGANVETGAVAAAADLVARQSVQRQQRSAAVLGQVAAQINKSLPMMVDKETELIAVSGFEGILVYDYRLVNYSAVDIDRGQLLAMKPQLAKTACTAPDTSTMLENGISLIYRYADKKGAQIAQLEITGRDCRS